MSNYESPRRRCTRCGEEKEGDPYRFCKCQREDRGLGDKQPHLDNPVDSKARANDIVNTLLNGKFVKSFGKRRGRK